MRTDTWDVPKSTASSVEHGTTHPSLRQPDETDKLKSTYQRAAEILCQSLDVDGVAFLDASVRVFGGLGKGQNAESTEGSAGDSDDSAGADSHSDFTTDEPRAKRTGVCQVLGCAQTMQEDGFEMYSPKDQSATKLTESFLRTLMRCNPHGKIWIFDEELKTHSEDGFSSEDSGDGTTAAGAPSPSTQRRKAARRERRSDGEFLQSAFPGARCIALHSV